MKLPNEEKNIGRSELSDILSSPVLKNLMTRKSKKYPFRRGKPNSNLAEERRGSPSIYEQSDIQEIIDIILSDSVRLKKIDDIVTTHEIFPKFLNYSFERMFKQMKQNETSFRNSYKPIITNKKLKDLDKSNFSKKSKNEWILAKNLDNEKINNLSEKYTNKYKNNLSRQQLNGLYVSGLLNFFNSFPLSQRDQIGHYLLMIEPIFQIFLVYLIIF